MNGSNGSNSTQGSHGQHAPVHAPVAPVVQHVAGAGMDPNLAKPMDLDGFFLSTNIKTQPYKVQIDGMKRVYQVEHGRDPKAVKGLIEADEMGLGKTFTMIGGSIICDEEHARKYDVAVNELKKRRNERKALITALAHEVSPDETPERRAALTLMKNLEVALKESQGRLGDPNVEVARAALTEAMAKTAQNQVKIEHEGQGSGSGIGSNSGSGNGTSASSKNDSQAEDEGVPDNLIKVMKPGFSKRKDRPDKDDEDDDHEFEKKPQIKKEEDTVKVKKEDKVKKEKNSQVKGKRDKKDEKKKNKKNKKNSSSKHNEKEHKTSDSKKGNKNQHAKTVKTETASRDKDEQISNSDSESSENDDIRHADPKVRQLLKELVDEFRQQMSDLKVDNGKTLIVVPLDLLSHWKRQLMLHANIDEKDICVYHGAPKVRDKISWDNIRWVITTYETVLSDSKKKIKKLVKFRWRRLIADEAQRLRNAKGKSSQAVMRLPASHRYAVTATPFNNSAADLAAICKFIRCAKWSKVKKWKTATPAEIRKWRESVLLKRAITDSDLGLPPLSEEILEVDLSEREEAFYDELETTAKASFQKFMKAASSGEDVLLRASIVLTRLLRLQQAVFHPLATMGRRATRRLMASGDGKDTSDEKEEEICNNCGDNDGSLKRFTECAHYICHGCRHLMETQCSICTLHNMGDLTQEHSAKTKGLIDKIVSRLKADPSDRFVVFAQWTTFLDIIEHYLRKENIEYLRIDGDIKTSVRMEIVAKFQSGTPIKNKKKHEDDKVVSLLDDNVDGSGSDSDSDAAHSDIGSESDTEWEGYGSDSDAKGKKPKSKGKHKTIKTKDKKKSSKKLDKGDKKDKNKKNQKTESTKSKPNGKDEKKTKSGKISQGSKKQDSKKPKASKKANGKKRKRQDSDDDDSDKSNSDDDDSDSDSDAKKSKNKSKTKSKVESKNKAKKHKHDENDDQTKTKTKTGKRKRQEDSDDEKSDDSESDKRKSKKAKTSKDSGIKTKAKTKGDETRNVSENGQREVVLDDAVNGANDLAASSGSGSGPDNDSALAVKRGPPVLLSTTHVGGLGLDLTSANVMFQVDQNYNPQIELQNRGRVFRIGQKRPVTVYRIRARAHGSSARVEKMMVRVKEFKRISAEYLLAGSVSAADVKKAKGKKQKTTRMLIDAYLKPDS